MMCIYSLPLLLLYLVSCSDTFDKLKEFYKELLNLPNKVTKVDHAEKFRQIMYIPLTYLKDLSAIISRFSDVYDRVSNSDHAEKFQQIMYIPLTYLKDLSAIISRFSDVYDRVSSSEIYEMSK